MPCSKPRLKQFACAARSSRGEPDERPRGRLSLPRGASLNSAAFRIWILAMAHPSLADERTSFIRFAHAHKFVTLFGILVPLAVFAVFVGYPIVFTAYLSFFDWNGMAP